MKRNEREALDLLSEECGEAVQMVGKSNRHGLDSYSPFDDAKTKNYTLLEREIGHIFAAVDILAHAGCVSKANIQQERLDKLDSVGQWLHYARIPPRAKIHDE